MENAVRISDIRLQASNEYKELSANIDGDRLFVRVPKHAPLHLKAEIFVGIALLEAMVSKRAIVVDDNIKVSAMLLRELVHIQQIYHCWNNRLHLIDIHAQGSEEADDFSAVGSYFSGGVDSSHTLLRNMSTITHLILSASFDFNLTEENWRALVNKTNALAEFFGKQLITVESNARDWMESRAITWNLGHGIFLSTLGGALGMKTQFVPSSLSYGELCPWGSHAFVDPLWSTDSSAVIHDGAGHRRTEKIAEILQNPILMENLLVCWRHIDRNCGECSKCVRTMAALHLFQASTPALPAYRGPASLSAVKIKNEASLSFVNDLISLARDRDKALLTTLERKRRRYYSNKIIHDVDTYILRGWAKRIYHRIRPPDWEDLRVAVTSEDYKN